MLNISEMVNVCFAAVCIPHIQDTNTIYPKGMYAAEDTLNELAWKAGSFMVTLVEQGETNSFSDLDAMNPVIERLTKCVLASISLSNSDKELHREMNRILGVVTGISSQRTPARLLLSTFDKAAVDECNRQLALACGIFGVRVFF